MQNDQNGHTKEGARNVRSQHHRINSVCDCLADSWAGKSFRLKYQEVKELAERQLASLPGVPSRQLHWESTGHGWDLDG